MAVLETTHSPPSLAVGRRPRGLRMRLLLAICKAMKGHNQYSKRPRDERGWIVPRAGTVTREVYDMMLEGRERDEIVALLGFVDARNIDARIWAIKNPDKVNASRVPQKQNP